MILPLEGINVLKSVSTPLKNFAWICITLKRVKVNKYIVDASGTIDTKVRGAGGGVRIEGNKLGVN
jgi:hypothetical protein